MMNTKKINILGTEYKIISKKYDEEEAFKRNKIDGFCDSYTKEIVVCDINTLPNWEHENKATKGFCEMQTLRHEIVHAFLAESGLDCSSFSPDVAWARNEEMVDWIALQGPKIYQAWKEAEAI